MAGSRTASTHEHHHRGNAVAASELSQWMISFARFVQFPSSPSPYPGLKPLGKRELDQPNHGTWLSTSTSKVSLQMVDEVNGSDVILTVQLGHRVLEEHYISKLNFTWPQMSCVSGFPSRGSRAIFVSYKDSSNEIQKFGLRFSTCDVALTFVVALKEKLKGLEEAGIQENETRCEVSFQSDYNPSNAIFPRVTEKEPNMLKPLDSHVPEMLPRLEYEAQNQKIETRSEISFQSDYNPSNEIVPRATEEKPTTLEPLGSYVPQMLPRLEYEAQNQKIETRSEISFQSDYNPSNAIFPRVTEKEPNMLKPLDSHVPEMLPRLEYEAQNQKIETRSEISFQSDYNPSNEIVPRATEEKPTTLEPLGSYFPQMLSRHEYETGQTFYPPQSAISHIPNLPPSFTTLLSGCFPNSTLVDAGQTTVKQDPDLKSQILKYMEDSSFQDMLQKVERIIDEIGGNWIL